MAGALLSSRPAIAAAIDWNTVYSFDMSLFMAQQYLTLQALTGFVGRKTVARVAPVESNASITAEADPASLRPPTAAEARLDAHLAAGRQTGTLPPQACAFPTHAHSPRMHILSSLYKTVASK